MVVSACGDVVVVVAVAEEDLGILDAQILASPRKRSYTILTEMVAILIFREVYLPLRL